MEVKTSRKAVYISLPKKYMAGLVKNYELDHGLFIKGLPSRLGERYVKAYFKEWGTITVCEIKVSPDSGINEAMAYVRFSTEDEADSADWAGPHIIGGSEVEVRRIVCPKMKDSDDQVAAVPVTLQN
ncbi:heterogeneous nuclear ribonucleoprotein A0 [Anabas testudineus]|uniref:RRM domain-containing protein n=1 Tax=Anabas testudineus TaxID=64144 RepID=A0A7N5ZQP3_ANATE|nr:heterogeneous nuclear ribonucleoprotein A0 [Anabas testudineus]